MCCVKVALRDMASGNLSWPDWRADVAQATSDQVMMEGIR